MGTGSAFVKGGLNLHSDHVASRKIPCFACHDPHGVPLAVGATPTGNAHLINFDRDYTASTAVPDPYYQTLAPGKGSCTVSCHNSPGNIRSYPSAASGRSRTPTPPDTRRRR